MAGWRAGLLLDRLEAYPTACVQPASKIRKRFVAPLLPLKLRKLIVTESDAPTPHLTHCVFFSLVDKSPDKSQKLIDDCHRYLTVPEGIVSLHAGRRVEDLQRDVNDQAFDVALVVVFESRAAQDVYQDHPDHLEFIAQNRENWASVRVFDAAAPVVR